MVRSLHPRRVRLINLPYISLGPIIRSVSGHSLQMEFMMKFRIVASVITALPLAVLSSAAGAQDAEAGKVAFNKCRPCHQVGENARNLVGPELNGLFGRKAGSVESFNYTDANKNSGIVWDDATFKDYIHNPRAKIPGTKMAFAGIRNDAEIDNLIAYLKQFGPDGNTSPLRH